MRFMIYSDLSVYRIIDKQIAKQRMCVFVCVRGRILLADRQLLINAFLGQATSSEYRAWVLNYIARGCPTLDTALATEAPMSTCGSNMRVVSVNQAGNLAIWLSGNVAGRQATAFDSASASALASRSHAHPANCNNCILRLGHLVGVHCVVRFDTRWRILNARHLCSRLSMETIIKNNRCCQLTATNSKSMPKPKSIKMLWRQR